MPNLAPDLADIQAIVRGIPVKRSLTRFLLLRFPMAETARAFLAYAGQPTSIAGLRAPGPFLQTFAFTQRGLYRLGLPADVLASFPAEFRQGMAQRADLLGDHARSHPMNWDAPWQRGIDAVIAVHSEDRRVLRARTLDLLRTARFQPTHVVVAGMQDAGRLLASSAAPVYLGNDPGYQPKDDQPLEHFGFHDGVTDTAVSGIDDREPVGNGNLKHGRWRSLATGEFLLGHLDELGEMPLAPSPDRLARNGTYLVYRKLEQDVDAFRSYVYRVAALYAVHPEYVAAKMVGRWRDGRNFVDRWRVNGFTYEMDPKGTHCPLGAHIRRVNPRDTLGHATALVSRHRILRRSFAYGALVSNRETQHKNKRGQGLVFVALNVDIGRQFEFIQQQWVNFGNDFNQGDDRDPIAGSNDSLGKMTIPADPDSGEPTVICTDLPRFVRTRGGDYFFVPSLTAIRGIIDGDFGAS